MTDHEKMSLTLRLVSVVMKSCREVYHLVRGFLTDSAFLRLFPTFLRLVSRVIGSIVGSAPVEHLHYLIWYAEM